MQLLKRKNYNVLINFAFRLHIHKTGSLRLQVATDIELDKNGEGSFAEDFYYMKACKARKPATSHIFMGMPHLAFAICGSKEYLVNMQENKNKSEK